MVSRLSIVLLLSIALVGIGLSQAHEVISRQDYWKVFWPNIPIPPTLKDLLRPETQDAKIDNVPMRIDGTQYPTTFFFKNDLYPGNKMNLLFSINPNAQPFGVLAFLATIPGKEIGFTYDEACTRNPTGKGENSKYCAKSLESMIDFAISKLGKNVQVLSSSFLENQDQYTIEAVESLGDKAVMCHRLNFRKAVFYCHETHRTKAYKVPLVAADGTKTHAIAVCHEDTSTMNARLLYELLKVKPGTATACHYLGNKAAIWVPNSDAYKPNIAA